MGFGPVLRREEGVKCAVHRLQCSAVYKPLLARTGNLPTPQLYISLRPARWTGDMLHQHHIGLLEAMLLELSSPRDALLSAEVA